MDQGPLAEGATGVAQGQADTERVVIPAALTGALLYYLKQAGEHERGGILLGHRDAGVTWVTMMVFPPQLIRERIACSFDVDSIEVLNAAKALLDDALIARMGTIVGWGHSHPHLGLFLSRTDIDTLSSWRQLDPRAVAIVADPFLRADAEAQIAWWGAPGPGRYPALDHSEAGFLTIPQVAQVAEALNESANADSRWDILTARALMTIASTRSPAAGAAAGPEPRQNLEG